MKKNEGSEGMDIPMSDPIVFLDYTIHRFWYGYTAQRSYQDKNSCNIAQASFPLKEQAQEQIAKWRSADDKISMAEVVND